jgi:hypothetical protein
LAAREANFAQSARSRHPKTMVFRGEFDTAPPGE